MVRWLAICIVFTCAITSTCLGFTSPVIQSKVNPSLMTRLNVHPADYDDGLDNSMTTRRHMFGKFSSILAIGVTSTFLADQQRAEAAEGSTIWLTGKAPKVPGQKPKEKSDTSGTRRDSSFLRSLSDCKSKCEATSGPDGLAKSKEDCLSECQDISCTTYEQCTFSITPRY